AIYSNRAVSSSSREKPSWLRSWSMTRSPFLWTFSPTQHVRKTGFSSLLFPAADGPRGAPRGPSSPPTSHALYRYPYAFSQFRDCPVTIDSHFAVWARPAKRPAEVSPRALTQRTAHEHERHPSSTRVGRRLSNRVTCRYPAAAAAFTAWS